MPSDTVTKPTVERTVRGMIARSRAWRQAGQSIAVVPTMGGLHEGHFALARAGNALADRVVATIFVNPTQFSANEDFGRYPRDEEGDLAALGALGVDAAFVPDADEMYPEGYATTLSVEGPALGLETDFRPHFFGGVATVVAKLFVATEPDYAMFGEKDYQQLLVVRRMAADLGLPVDVRGEVTVRETDGLALSSRNRYLSPAERDTAPLIHRTLTEIAISVRAEEDPMAALDDGRTALVDAGFKVDYLELRNAITLALPQDIAAEPLRLLVAAHLGRTRLIDNIAV